MQIGDGHTLAIDEGAVGAAQVNQPTVRRVDLHQEMQPREVFVLAGKPEVSLLRAAHEEGVVSGKGEDPTRVGPLHHRDHHAHGLSSFVKVDSQHLQYQDTFPKL